MKITEGRGRLLPILILVIALASLSWFALRVGPERSYNIGSIKKS